MIGRRASRAASFALSLGLLACTPGEEGDGGPQPSTDAGPTSFVDASPMLDASVPDVDGSTDPGWDASRGDDDAGTDAGVCLPRLAACGAGSEACCGDLTCGTTTAGQVCCGGEGASCATPDGSDCCGDSLLCVGGRCQLPGGPAPRFSAPYPCGERWTYDHHSSEVRLALDFVRADGVETNGSVQLASAPGVATRHFEAGGAGNYIAIEHGDGWKTYYFHLSSFIAEDGAWVDRGDEIGLTGSTGASSGPHIHYEQLKHGAGQTIHIEGVSLAPYPPVYNVAYLVSENRCSADGRSFQTWGSDRPVHQEPSTSSPVVATLPGPTRVFVDCQARGETVNAEGYTNEWWAHLRDEGGYITNIYIDDPASYLPGVPECP